MATTVVNPAANAAWVGDFQRIQGCLTPPGASALFFSADSKGYTPLHYAASLGNVAMINAILTAPQMLGSGVINVRDTKQGNTPLLQAVQDGQEEAAALLIDCGAEVNAQNFEGATALFIAAKRGSASMVNLLLENGASLQIPDLDGATPLHAAVASGNLHVVLDLVDHGAWLNAPDNEGDTPLHWCVREGQVELLKLLVRRGADIFARNEDGETAFDLACELNEPVMVQVLAVTAALAASLSTNGSAAMELDNRMADDDEEEEPEEHKDAMEAALMAIGAGEKAEWTSAWTSRQHTQSQQGRMPLNIPLAATQKFASSYYSY